MVGLLSLLWALGCTPVPTWKRAALMTPVMEDPADPALDHVNAVRGSQSGADAAGGAPCGCD